jgi:hypothetical protein
VRLRPGRPCPLHPGRRLELRRPGRPDERRLVVGPDGTPYLTVYVEPHHDPPPPHQGVGRILFSPPAGGQLFLYFLGVAQDAGGGPLPADAVVERIHNTHPYAQGLEVRLDDPDDGNVTVADLLLLADESARAPFAGHPARFAWRARRDLPDLGWPIQAFAIELAWARPTQSHHHGGDGSLQLTAVD